MTDHPIKKNPERSRRGRPTGDTARAASTAAWKARQQSTVSAAILEEARLSGLLEGGKSAHVSFRVPRALVEAAKRETGITSASELGTLALAMLAQPDPVVAVMKRNRGRLGKDHKLDY